MGKQSDIEELMNTIERLKKAGYGIDTDAKPKKRKMKKVATFEDLVFMSIITWCACNIMYNEEE